MIARQNTRIRQGNIQDLQVFYNMLKKQNKNCKPFYYYYNMLSNGNTLKNNIKLYVAENKEEKIISGGIFISYSNYTECLVTAAEDTVDTENANLLLHWTVLEKTWDNGIDIYKISTANDICKDFKMQELNNTQNWEIVFDAIGYIYFKCFKKLNHNFNL